MDILAAMQCQKLGKPTWTVFSTGGGLGVKLFWRIEWQQEHSYSN